MAENQGPLDDELADAAVPEVVGVGAADADGGDLDQHLVAGYLGQRDLFHVEGFGAGEDTGGHRFRQGAGHAVSLSRVTDTSWWVAATRKRSRPGTRKGCHRRCDRGSAGTCP